MEVTGRAELGWGVPPPPDAFRRISTVNAGTVSVVPSVSFVVCGRVEPFVQRTRTAALPDGKPAGASRKTTGEVVLVFTSRSARPEDGPYVAAA